MENIFNEIINNANIFTWINSVAIILIPIFGAYYIKKFEANLDIRNQKIMEEIRQEKVRNQHLFEQSIASLVKNNELLIEKSTLAIDELWKIIVYINKTLGGMITTYTVLTKEEYKNPSSFNSKESFLIEFNEYDFENLSITVENKSKELRPFIQSELWRKFLDYKLFMLRSSYLFTKGIKNDKIQPWYEDQHTFNAYKSLLGEYILEDHTSIGAYASIVNLMEEIIILEMRKFLEGKKLSDDIIRFHQNRPSGYSMD